MELLAKGMPWLLSAITIWTMFLAGITTKRRGSLASSIKPCGWSGSLLLAHGVCFHEHCAVDCLHAQSSQVEREINGATMAGYEYSKVWWAMHVKELVYYRRLAKRRMTRRARDYVEGVLRNLETRQRLAVYG
jgi:hypothetical protein